MTNPLLQLKSLGQSVWLDYIRRDMLKNGALRKLVEEDGLCGVTSNPSIFEKAIAGGDYDSAIKQGASYEDIAIQDIQDAADILKPVYDTTQGVDGYVSLEVSPLLARDSQGSLEEGRRLWKAVNRKNLMIKIPGTPEGVPVIRQLIFEGVNVNVTLLFSQDAYEQSALAYIEGLEARAKEGKELGHVASVASFFVSRIDSLVDKLLQDKGPAAQELKGKIAVANAKGAFQVSEKLYSQPRWKALQAKGAHVQRLLWASTGTKNPAYSDILYIEELVGPNTVNTTPPATFDAYRDHGRPALTLSKDLPQAQEQMAELEKFGISFHAVTEQLLEEGIQLFADAFHKLLTVVAQKQKALL